SRALYNLTVGAPHKPTTTAGWNPPAQRPLISDPRAAFQCTSSMERAEYDRMAALEDTMWWYRALHAGLVARLRRLSLPDGARVLDAGCGTGGLLRRVGQAMPGLKLTGLEYDGEAAAIA